MFTQTKLNCDVYASGDLLAPQEWLYFSSIKFGKLRAQPKTTDGISDPRLLEGILEKFGKYVFSGIMHDGAFQDEVQWQDDLGNWVKWVSTEQMDNELIDECLASQGCPSIERVAIYDALEMFGWVAFDYDRNV